jgi:cell division transport system permease protein
MKEMLTSIRRTPYQSLTAFLVLFFTLFLSTALFISISFLSGLLGYVESKPQVTVYFQTKTDTNEIFKVKDELVTSGKVLSIKYISKDEAFQIYKDLNKDNPLLLEMVSSDILPASLEIFANKPAFLPEIAEFLKKQPGVDEVVFQKDIVNRLLNLTNILRKLSFGFFGFLMFMAIIVLITTTSFKIALKKDEIQLLQLLGARKSYIRAPFLSEAAFFGFVASTSSFMIIGAVLAYFNPFLSSYLKGIPNLILNFEVYKLTVWPINLEFLLITYVLSTLFGLVISLFSSYMATDKYLQ